MPSGALVGTRRSTCGRSFPPASVSSPVVPRSPSGSPGGSATPSGSTVVDATVGEVGGRIHLRWRLRLQAERLGAGLARRRAAGVRRRRRPRTDRASTCCARATGRRHGWLRPTPGADGDPTSATTRSRTSPRPGRCPVQPVRLADGHDAWVVLGHDAARRRSTTSACLRTWSRRSTATPSRGRGPARSRLRPPHARRRSARPHPLAAPGRPGLLPVAGRGPRARDPSGSPTSCSTTWPQAAGRSRRPGRRVTPTRSRSGHRRAARHPRGRPARAARRRSRSCSRRVGRLPRRGRRRVRRDRRLPRDLVDAKRADSRRRPRRRAGHRHDGDPLTRRSCCRACSS